MNWSKKKKHWKLKICYLLAVKFEILFVWFGSWMLFHVTSEFVRICYWNSRISWIWFVSFLLLTERRNNFTWCLQLSERRRSRSRCFHDVPWRELHHSTAEVWRGKKGPFVSNRKFSIELKLTSRIRFTKFKTSRFLCLKIVESIMNSQYLQEYLGTQKWISVADKFRVDFLIFDHSTI